MFARYSHWKPPWGFLPARKPNTAIYIRGRITPKFQGFTDFKGASTQKKRGGLNGWAFDLRDNNSSRDHRYNDPLANWFLHCSKKETPTEAGASPLVPSHLALNADPPGTKRV